MEVDVPEQDSIADPRDVRIQELIDRIERQARAIEQQAARIRELEEKLEQLQALLKAKAQSKAAKKPEFTENDSLGRNKLQNKDKKKSTNERSGRTPQYTKRDCATLSVSVGQLIGCCSARSSTASEPCSILAKPRR